MPKTTLNLSKSLYCKGKHCLKQLWLYKFRPELTAEVGDFQAILFRQGDEILQETTKGAKIRIVGLNPNELYQRLKLLREQKPSSEFVVERLEGGMVSHSQLTRLLRRGVKETGIRKVCLHGLRHTYATLYMQAGGDLYDLQKLMGHIPLP